MSGKDLRRELSILPIGTVIKLTDLSARQIRYYEKQKLLNPKRSATNQRLYSLNEVDLLLEIKDYLSSGFKMTEIKQIFVKNQQLKTKKMENKPTRQKIRQIFRADCLNQGRFLPHDTPNLNKNHF